MSFFDEADEPRAEPRREPRRRRPSGRGRPPTEQQAIQTRRAVAVALTIVVIVVIALLVHSCDVSQLNSSLRDYTNGVASLVQQSDDTGSQLFRELSSGSGHSNPTGLQTQLNGIAAAAQGEYARAQNFSVPGQMQSAQDHLLLTMRMRRDGTRAIAKWIQPALGTTTNTDAINQIATANSQFFASDVLYKTYTAPEIAAALHAAGIGVGGTNGETINAGQFVSDLGWLQAPFIAAKLGSKLANSHVNTSAPGLHGHSLNSVSVGSNTLSTSVANTVPATPAPTFVLNLTNGGQYTEYNVKCTVTVSGLSDTGTTTLPQTTPGQTTDCSVTLPSAPTPGTYQVTANVAKVPGEKDISNNTLTFAVTFQ